MRKKNKTIIDKKKKKMKNENNYLYINNDKLEN